MLSTNREIFGIKPELLRIWLCLSIFLCILFTTNDAILAQDSIFNSIQKPGNLNGILQSMFKNITVNLTNTPLENALKVISDKGGFTLNYNASRLPLSNTVSVSIQNKPAINALMKALNDSETGLIITGQGQLIIKSAAGLYGKITGTVKDKSTGEPLVGANVLVNGTFLGSAADSEGNFIISKLSPGIYNLRVSMIGYETKQINPVLIREKETVEIASNLEKTEYSLKEIIVTPGHFSLMRKEPSSNISLSSEDIRSFPQLGEDIYRAVNRLPGLSGNDFSAKFTVRGGEHDEVLVLLDGMELYNPFHLKDFGGSLSIVDINAINSIDMITGSFPAEYGKRLSGVFNIKTRTPESDKLRSSLSLSFVNARLLMEGKFNNGKGNWLLLARRGYIDYVLRTMGMDDDFEPVYYDVLSKIQYFLSPNHLLSAHILRSNDDMFAKDNPDEDLNAGYGNTYGWLSWDAQLNSNLYAKTILSKGRVEQDRFLEVYNNYNTLDLETSEIRGFDFLGLKQDWHYELSSNLLFKWGLDYKRLSADYDYYDRRRNYDSGTGLFDKTEIQYNINGTEVGVYLSNRLRPITNLTTELGIRYDYASWTDDRNFSPRVNISYKLLRKTVLRAGWGRFYQTHKIHGLNIIDYDVNYYPAEMSEHKVIGLEHGFNNSINLRIEAYHKGVSHIRPRYENYRNHIDVSPERSWDRIRIDPDRGESKGVEIFAYRDNNSKHRWWMNYSYSFAEEDIDGITVPKNMDQRHTFNLDYNYRPNDKWAFNIYWHYHSGWPYTDTKYIITEVTPMGALHVESMPGEINHLQYPAYHRLDLKVSRNFVTSKGRASAFFEVRNVYYHKNVRAYEYTIFIRSLNSYFVIKKEKLWLPIIPSFGITWDF
jgi:outer membrane cobalamin receptor